MKSPIIYNQLKNNFSQISNFALLDTRLSAKAYKLYAYMCYRIGLSDSWQFNTFEILKHFKEGDKAMRVAFKELIDAGFLERKRVRNDKGIFERTDYTIYAEPVNTGSNPQVQNRHVDNRRVDNPPVDNAALSNKERKNKDSNNKEFISLPAEEKKDFLKKIWLEKKLKSSAEKYFLFRQKQNWKGLSNLEDDIAWWENGFLEKNPDTGKKSLVVEPKEIQNIRAEIKRALLMEQNDYYRFFAPSPIEKTDTGFIIKVSDEKALKYQEVLAGINVRIEVK